MKCSFDFDSTLSRRSVRKLAKEFIDKGYEVHVVTSRYEDTSRYAFIQRGSDFNKDLFRVTDHLGIKRENIHFVNMVSKYKFFQENPGFLFHLDDDSIEITEINIETPEVKGILCAYTSDVWITELTEFLDMKKGLD